jgi:hypothetical protein
MSKGINWDKENQRNRAQQTKSRQKPVDLEAAFETLSFYLKERDVDTRYVISIPHIWDALGIDEMLPYFKAHRSGSCKALRALKNGQWCRISRATAESVDMAECDLCSPYSTH